MFVFGSAINGGVSGTNPDLTEATESNNWQLETYQFDYRETLELYSKITSERIIMLLTPHFLIIQPMKVFVKIKSMNL